MAPQNIFSILHRLQADNRVILYGAGGGGYLIRDFLKTFKKVSVAGFIDSFKTGDSDGVPIHSLDDYLGSRHENDVIIIATQYGAEIGPQLDRHAITPYGDGQPLVGMLTFLRALGVDDLGWLANSSWLDPEAGVFDADAVLAQALDHHRHGRVAEATVLYSQLLSVHPNHADALHLLGMLARQAGQLDEAARLFTLALNQENPTYSFHPALDAVMGLPGLPGPINAWVVPTLRCNARCRTCRHTNEAYHEAARDMDPAVFAKVKEQVLPGTVTIQLVGGGEPLYSRQFSAMFDACADQGKKLFMISNGTLITPALALSLIERHADVMISVDGTTPEVFQAIRPTIRLERVLSSLDMLREARRRQPSSRSRITINMVVMETNVHQLPDMVELAHRHGVDGLSVSDLCETETLSGQNLSRMPDLVDRHFPRAMARARELGIALGAPGYFHQRPERQGSDDAADTGTTPPAFDPHHIFPRKCYMPWTHCSISEDGSVYACCERGIVLGNLAEQDFAAIWNGPRYRLLRRLIGTNNPPGACKRCTLKTGITQSNFAYFQNFLHRHHLATQAIDDPAVAVVSDAAGTAVDLNGTRFHSFATRASFRVPRVAGARLLGIHIARASALGRRPRVGRAVVDGRCSAEFINGGGLVLVEVPADAQAFLHVDLILETDIDGHPVADEPLAVSGFSSYGWGAAAKANGGL